MTEFLLLIIAAGIGVLIFRKPGSQWELPFRIERVQQPKRPPEIVTPRSSAPPVWQVPPVAEQVMTPAVEPTVKPTAVPPSKFGALVLMMMALLYLVSPIDFVPDIIPVLGWLDDIGIVSFAGKNLKKAFKPPVIQA